MITAQKIPPLRGAQGGVTDSAAVKGTQSHPPNSPFEGGVSDSPLEGGQGGVTDEAGQTHSRVQEEHPQRNSLKAEHRASQKNSLKAALRTAPDSPIEWGQGGVNSYSPSSFTQYRELLAHLADPDVFTEILQQVGARRSWWPLTQSWQRTFEHFDPEKKAIATLLFETENEPQEICTVQLYLDPDDAAMNIRQPIFQHLVGSWLITRFPYDPDLLSLDKVIREAAPCTVVRYRPHKRCTMRLEPCQERPQAYAKTFADERGRLIHEEGEILWETAGRGELDFRVAEPSWWSAATNTLYQGHVPGQPVLPQLFSAGGPAVAFRMGQAIASLSLSNLQPAQTFDELAQWKRTEKYAAEIIERIPALEERINEFLERLHLLHESIGERPLRPIHGSPHAHQWLDDGEKLGLVDFDRISLGHPELDIATFIAEMDYENPQKAPIAQINAAFIEGYEARAGKLDRNLLRAYRAHKRFAKAFKAAKSLRSEGERKAVRNVNFAMELVGNA